VEEGLELLARRNGSEPNPDVSVWDALDPGDPRNQVVRGGVGWPLKVKQKLILMGSFLASALLEP